MPEPFATLSRVLRELSSSQHGYDGTWGRMLIDAFTARGLADVDGRGEVWTMRGGTDSAEWYVAALERALDVLPASVFPAGFDPRGRDRAGARARRSRSCRRSRSRRGDASRVLARHHDERGHHPEHAVRALGVREDVAVECPDPGCVVRPEELGRHVHQRGEALHRARSTTCRPCTAPAGDSRPRRSPVAAARAGASDGSASPR